KVGSNYFLYEHGTSSGPELMYGGSAVVAGQFGPWLPIAAEQVTGGYKLAFSDGQKFSLWTTDSNANFLTTTTTAWAGSDPALQGLETTFQQDLNGDGTIGIVPHFDIAISYSGNSAYQSYFT